MLRQLSSEPTESDLLRHVSNRLCLSQHKYNRRGRGKQKPFDGQDLVAEALGRNVRAAVGGRRGRDAKELGPPPNSQTDDSGDQSSRLI